MRPLLTALAMAGALALWGVGLVVGVPFPWEVTVRPAGRASPVAHPGMRVLRAEVTATLPGLDGLALGDRVQFDRYGILPPVAGSVLCLPFFGVQMPRMAVTPLGGLSTHATSVAFTVDDSGAVSGCESASAQSQLPVYARRDGK